MIVMLSNNTGIIARELLQRWPDNIGHLLSPGGWRAPFRHYALDNGRGPKKKRLRHNIDWSESSWMKLLHAARQHDVAPRWVTVPDVLMDAAQTIKEWEYWAPRIRDAGWQTLAFVVQDGMRMADVPKDADVVFVGGSIRWKRQTMATWCCNFPRVHVGAINTSRWLWRCHDLGAESCDGTGWFRGDRIQLAGLWDYLKGERTRWNTEQQLLIQ